MDPQAARPAPTVFLSYSRQDSEPVARSWLLSFFEALQGKDRAALLAGLQNAAATFTAAQKP